MSYATFITGKSQVGTAHGFEPLWLPDTLFGFQRTLDVWAIRRGRCALFEAPGMGKTFQQLVWAENVVRHTNRPVLVLTPLAVGRQTIREAEKFGIEATRDHTKSGARIVVLNYERLHHVEPSRFAGVVGDESSCIKAMDGKRRADVTEFMRTIPYRLLCTATAAPNDYIELGTSSEALGEMGQTDMLGRFFKNNQNTIKPRAWTNNGHDFADERAQSAWSFKPHAEGAFWRWVCSWARACRTPSDVGGDDAPYVLPELVEREHVVAASKKRPGYLLDVPAYGLREEREERRRTINDRCEYAAGLVRDTGKSAVVWCHLNDEGDALEKAIPDCVQVSGKDSDDEKERKLEAFTAGEVRVLVTKPVIGAWGLNWQHNAHMVEFPSHSFEQRYQAIRRSLRFGQKSAVVVDTVSTPGEAGILANYKRKAEQADKMFAELVACMNDALRIERRNDYTRKPEIPAWL